MLKEYARLFYGMGQLIGGQISTAELIPRPEANLPNSTKESMLRSLGHIRTICSDVDVPVSLKSIQWAEKELTNAKAVTVRQLGEIYRELGRTIEHELSSRLFIYLPPNRAIYYEQNNDGEVAKYRLLTPKARKKFSRSIEDAEEAAKCIALGRYTAAVFHLMRVMERAVQRLGKKLGVSIPVEEKDWGLISAHINGALKRMPNTTPQEKRIHSRYAKAAVYLDNVRESWRNPTMHPKETYTEEEAENAFRFVKQYMEYLAGIL
jgi:HEPN domain-containing protein